MFDLYRMRKSPMLHRMVFSYASIALVSILITAIVLTLQFQSREIQQINNSAIMRLTLADQAASLIVEQSHVIGNQAMMDMQLASFMTRTDASPLDKYRALLKLRQYRGSSLLFDHLGIYNARRNEYFSEGLIVKNFSERYRATLEKSSDRNSYVYYMPQVIENPFMSISVASRYVITFLYLNRYKASSDTSCFTISIQQSAFVEHARASYQTGNGELFVIDREGTIISHMNDAYFMQSVADMSYIGTILGSESAKGSFVDTIGGVANLISYVRSANFDWTFVSAQPYGIASAELLRLRRLAFAISVVVLAAALVLIIYQSFRMYRPVANLAKYVNKSAEPALDETQRAQVEELAYIESVFNQVLGKTKMLQDTLRSARPILSNSVYMLLLSGRANDIPDGATAMLDELQLWDGSMLRCAIVKPDISGLSLEDARREHVRLIRELNGLLASRAHLFTQYRIIPADDRGVVLIAQYENAEAALAALNDIRHELADTLQLDVCMAIGEQVGTMEELHLSYAGAKRAETCVYTQGTDGLLFPDDSSSDVPGESSYPVELEKELHGALNSHKQQQYEKALAELEATLGVLPAEKARHCADQLMLSIYKLFYEFLSLQEQAVLAYPDNSNFRRLKGDISDLRRIGLHVIQALRDQRSNRRNAALDSVIERIEKEYSDPNLTVDALADWVGISANYLSRMFKAVHSESLHSHLTNRRMEKAADLLAESDAPVVQISEMVGISNSNYFFTMFKKRFGVTPIEYRRSRSDTCEDE